MFSRLRGGKRKLCLGLRRDRNGDGVDGGNHVFKPAERRCRELRRQPTCSLRVATPDADKLNARAGCEGRQMDFLGPIAGAGETRTMPRTTLFEFDLSINHQPEWRRRSSPRPSTLES